VPRRSGIEMNVRSKLGMGRVALVASIGFAIARLIFVSNAFAQEPTPLPGEAEVGRVIVTGSNIPTAQEQASIPVTTYTAQWLQKSGSSTPVEGLRQLPTFVGNAATENNSNGGDGSAQINLRGLGAENTLVLINGRRMIGGNGLAADVNLLPLSSIQKVDILKDGASSIYGSDAVAGVVNFILWNDTHDNGPLFEGAEFEIRYGNTTDTDANVRQGWIRGGITGLDGKVAIFASAEYYDRAAIYTRDRYISSTADLSNNHEINVNPSRGIAGLRLGGFNLNGAVFAGRVLVSPPTETFPQAFPVGQLVLSDLTTNQVTPASYRRFAASGPGTDSANFNFRAFSPAIPAMEKSMEYISGRYKVFGDGLQIYSDMMYSHYRQDNGLAGSPFFFNIFTNGLPQARASIFNPFGDRLGAVFYLLQRELGNRLVTFDKDWWRWGIGAKGDLDFVGNPFIGRLGYDAGITYERFDATETDAGDAVRSKILEQIALGRFNPFIGQNAPLIGVAPTYRTVQIGTTAGGEPIFERVPTGETAPYDNVLAAQLASYLAHSFYHQKDFVYDATVNARLFPNLWNGGIDVAGGYQRIWEQQHSIPDPVQAADDSLGLAAAPNFKYRQEVNAWYAEMRVPFVISTMNVPLIHSFEVDYAYRFEEFDDTDLTNPGPHESASFDNDGNHRVTIRYQPIPDLLLRGTWGQSFRSPTPDDLFTPVTEAFTLLFDPVTRSVNPVRVLIGGNTDLKPEKTETWTAGLVYSPKFVSGFTLTADWYQVFTRDLIISGPDYAPVLLFADPFNPAIQRDEFNNVVFIEALNHNAGKRLVQGLDLTAVYQLPTTNFGQFTFTLGWNHFFTWKAEPIDGLGTHNFVGDYNTGTLPLAPGAIPFNKGFFRFEWEYKLGPGNVDFVAQGNYIGDFEDDPQLILGNRVVAQNPGTRIEPNWVLHRRVTDYMTLDLQLSYEFVRPPLEALIPGSVNAGKDAKIVPDNLVAGAVETGPLWRRMLGGTKITAGVINAFDRNPPTVLAAFLDNYDTSLYSIRNRFWYVALSKKF
jgi:iron complex outermembrane recepter protein